jgi:outer membrane protein assembly factor BamA
VEAALRTPRLAGGRLAIDVRAQRSEFPEEEYFGPGPSSRREDYVTYGLKTTLLGASATASPAKWAGVGGGVEYLDPRAGAFDSGPRPPSFDTDRVPGAGVDASFVKSHAFAEINYREPRGNPRSGGRYLLSFQRFDDQATGRSSFARTEVDLQHYVPLLRDRRVLALHALISTSHLGAGRDVPFYLQRTLGGPDDLRGFRRFRFRDRHLFLLQAEYRWEIFTAVDGALFYDAGQVAPSLRALSLGDLESDYGIGFRFGTINGIFLRVEGAFGSSGGRHFVMRFGNVF